MCTIALCLLYLKLVKVHHCMWSSWVLYIPLNLAQEDKTSHSCCWICKRKVVLMHVHCMHILRIISCYNLFLPVWPVQRLFSAEANILSLQPHHLLTQLTGKPKIIIKFKILTGADWYDLQLKQTVYQLTLPRLPILIFLLEHHRVHFLWWILHAYIYMSDPVEILDVSSLKPQILYTITLRHERAPW